MILLAANDHTALDITNVLLGVSVLALWGVVLGAAAREGWRRWRGRSRRTPLFVVYGQAGSDLNAGRTAKRNA